MLNLENGRGLRKLFTSSTSAFKAVFPAPTLIDCADCDFIFRPFEESFWPDSVFSEPCLVSAWRLAPLKEVAQPLNCGVS